MAGNPGGQAAQPADAPQQAALPSPPGGRATASPVIQPEVPVLSPPAIDPADIVGLTRGRIRDLLGEPAFVRRESLAEFWRYRHDACILELYFYRGTGEPVLGHLETRLRTQDGAAGADCLDGLVAANRRN